MCLACTETTNTTAQDQPTATIDSAAVTPKALVKKRTKPDCNLAGKFLAGNECWLKNQARLLYILADSTTTDKTLGESHRVLAVYNTNNCELIDRQVLPVDGSPDFPYYFAEINYNKLSQLIAIKGTRTVYCYDVQAGKLLEVLQPQFKNERLSEDAQAGMINRLEVWENYLIGYAAQYGAFVFKLEKGQAPQAVLPAAEYRLSEDNFSSLFLLESMAGKHQAIIPRYDYEAEQFKINPLFEAAKSIPTSLPNHIENNRFLVLAEQGGATSIAIDMRSQEMVSLPPNLQAAKAQTILKWLQEKR